MKPGENVLIVYGPHVLCEVKGNWPLYFCWFFDGGKTYRAHMRDDSMIYIAGFRTRDEAESWARKEGIIPKK